MGESYNSHPRAAVRTRNAANIVFSRRNDTARVSSSFDERFNEVALTAAPSQNGQDLVVNLQFRTKALKFLLSAPVVHEIPD